MIRGVHLAQVEDVHPDEYTVSVIFPNLTSTTGAKIRLGEEEFALVQPGRFGIVAFYSEDRRSGVWLKTLPDTNNNLIPHDLLIADPKATLRQYPHGGYSIHKSSGVEEHVLPDGSLLKIACTERNVQRTARKRTRPRGELFGGNERVAWQPPQRQPADVFLELASGISLHIDAQGVVHLSNGSISFRMESNRFVLDGEVVLAGGTQAVARENDAVEVTLPAGVVAIPGGSPLPAPLILQGFIRPRPGGKVKAG